MMSACLLASSLFRILVLRSTGLLEPNNDQVTVLQVLAARIFEDLPKKNAHSGTLSSKVVEEASDCSGVPLPRNQRVCAIRGAFDVPCVFMPHSQFICCDC